MTPEDKAKMNVAAGEAEKDFYDNVFEEGTPGDVVEWAKRWYPKCGYKRLGLIISQRENFADSV